MGGADGGGGKCVELEAGGAKVERVNPVVGVSGSGNVGEYPVEVEDEMGGVEGAG